MSANTWSAVDSFVEAALIPTDEAFGQALAASAAAGLPAIQVSPSQGRLLYILARTQRAQRILEVGTLGGYSTLWLARAAPRRGKLITLEINPLHASVARENFLRAGMERVIELREGPALDSLKGLRAEKPEPFDLTFIDADKVNNLAYFEAALGLSRPGSLILVDNVVRDGEIVAEKRGAAAAAVREMIQAIGNDPRVCATVIQTVGSKGYDGFLLARMVD
jgi:predicted O-methyltransferase YrrM